MPTYDYVCRECGHTFEQFQSIRAEPLRDCPACARPTLDRLIGPGGGLLFKGSGFYSTDYRSDSYKKAAAAERPAPAAADAKTSESKKQPASGDTNDTKAA